MQEAAKKKIAFIVLDRPNPLTGNHVEGPMLDPDELSFVGAFPLPLRHGLTMGELAKLENAELALGADLQVIEMTGWKRDQWFDFTGLPWVNPSPNIRNLNAATLYPAIAMLEYSSNYSVGRGTEKPFEHVGADWINGRELTEYLTARSIPGVRVSATEFIPASSNLNGKKVQGIQIELTDRDVFSATQFGMELAMALGKLYPGKISWEADRRLIGSKSVISALADQTGVMAAATRGVPEFIALRQKYLLYQ